MTSNLKLESDNESDDESNDESSVIRVPLIHEIVAGILWFDSKNVHSVDDQDIEEGENDGNEVRTTKRRARMRGRTPPTLMFLALIEA